MKIKVGNNYETVGGMAVRIYSVDGGFRPIHGATYDKEAGTWFVKSWLDGGKYDHTGNDHELDLIIPKNAIWVNVYPSSFFPHKTKEAAKAAYNFGRQNGRIAVKFVEAKND